MNKKIIIGSRGSKLALIYAQNAKKKIIQNTDLKNEDIIIKKIITKLIIIIEGINLSFILSFEKNLIFHPYLIIILKPISKASRVCLDI